MLKLTIYFKPGTTLDMSTSISSYTAIVAFMKHLHFRKSQLI